MSHFGEQTLVGISISISWAAQWRHLVSTIEGSVRGGDAALCQITSTIISLFMLMIDLLALEPTFSQAGLEVT